MSNNVGTADPKKNVNVSTLLQSVLVIVTIACFLYYVLLFDYKATTSNLPKAGLVIILCIGFIAMIFAWLLFSRNTNLSTTVGRRSPNWLRIPINGLLILLSIISFTALINSNNSLRLILEELLFQASPILILVIIASILGILIIAIWQEKEMPQWHFAKIKKNENLIALLIEISVILLFISPILSDKRIPINTDLVFLYSPWKNEYGPPTGVINPVLSDSVDSVIPSRVYFYESVKEGEFPLWNNRITMGSPFGLLMFADTFTINNLSSLAFGPAYGAVVYHCLKQLITGFFFYLFLKSIGLSFSSRIFGMLTVSFSTFVIAFAAWKVPDSLIFIPIILYAFEEYRKSTKYRWLVAIAFAVLFALLSGFPAIILYSLLFTCIYITFRIFTDENLPSIRQKLTVLSHLVFAFFIGILLSGFSFLPTIEFFNHIGLGYREGAGLRRFHPDTLLRFWGTMGCGSPIYKNFICPSNFNETAIYTGFLSLLLSPFSLLNKKCRKLGVFSLITFILIFAISFGLFGINTFLGRLPVLKLSSNTRIVALLPIISAMIGSLGFDALLRSKLRPFKVFWLILPIIFYVSIFIFGNNLTNFLSLDLLNKLKTLTIFIGSVTLIIILALSKSEAVKWWSSFAMCVLLFLDLTNGMVAYNGASRSDLFYPPTPSLQYLQANQDSYERFIAIDRRNMIPSMPLSYSLNSINNHWWVSDSYRKVLSTIDENLYAKSKTTQPIFSPTSIDYFSQLLDIMRVKYLTIDPSPIRKIENNSLILQPEYNNYLPLTQADSFTQTFVAPRDQQIDHLSLAIAGINASQTLSLNLKIETNDQFLFESETKCVSMDNTRWFECPFNGFFVNSGDNVSIRIGADVIFAGVKLAVANFDIYPEGKLIYNGSEVNQDLAFMIFNKDQEVLSQFKPVYDKDLVIYENMEYKQNLPMVDNFIAMDPDRCEDQLVGIDLFTTAIVQDPPNEQQGETSVSSPNDSAFISKYLNNSLEIITTSTSKKMVILSDTWYPGWKATIDGQPAKIYKTNCIMRGILVPPGSHVIRMSYEPTSFKFGLAITLLGLLLLISGYALMVKRNKVIRT